MSLDLRSQLLEVLDNRAVDCSPKIGVLVSDDAGFVSDVVENIL